MNFYSNYAIYFFLMASVTQSPSAHPDPRADGALVTKASLRAAERLGALQQGAGAHPRPLQSTVSHESAGAYAAEPEQKPYELALLFVRLYRSLDSIVEAGHGAVTRTRSAPATARSADAPRWRASLSISGLVETIAYLDARRALA